MRVGINATVFKNPVTGVAKRLLHLVIGIKKDHPAIQFFFFSPHSFEFRELFDGFGEFKKSEEINAIKKIEQEFQKVITPSLSEWVWLHWKLPFLLMKYKIDIFDAPWGGGLPFFFHHFFLRNSVYRKIKWMMTIHDVIPLEIFSVVFSKYKEKKKFYFWERLFDYINRWVFRRRLLANFMMANKVAVVSTVTKNKLIQFFPEFKDKSNKIFVSPNGVENSFIRFEPNGKNKKKLLDWINQGKLLIEGKSPSFDQIPSYFFYVGGFNHRKNLKTLLLVFHKMRLNKSDKTDDFFLVLSGKRNRFFKTEIIPIVKELGIENIIMMDYLEESRLPAFYYYADFFVYPSLLEGFGMPVLESVSCGKACLVHYRIEKLFDDFCDTVLIKSVDFDLPESGKLHLEKLTLVTEKIEKLISQQKMSGDFPKKKVIKPIQKKYLWKNIVKDYAFYYFEILGHCVKKKK